MIRTFGPELKDNLILSQSAVLYEDIYTMSRNATNIYKAIANGISDSFMESSSSYYEIGLDYIEEDELKIAYYNYQLGRDVLEICTLKQSKILYLFFVEKRSKTEIANMIGITKSAILQHLRAIHKKWRKRGGNLWLNLY